MVDRIRIALEAAGIEFLFHPGESPGLRTARR
jgi:hypothetical protein